MSDDEADNGDIYENLPNFFLDETYKNLEEEKKVLTAKVEELGKQLDVLKKENEKLAAKVNNLGKNISCLYKTAIKELERKDQIIADLRRERDNLLFRRETNYSLTTETKRSSRKQLTPTKKVRNGNVKRSDSKVKSKEEDASSAATVAEKVEVEQSKEKMPEKNLTEIVEMKKASPEVKDLPVQENVKEVSQKKIIVPVADSIVSKEASADKIEVQVVKTPKLKETSHKENVIPAVEIAEVREVAVNEKVLSDVETVVSKEVSCKEKVASDSETVVQKTDTVEALAKEENVPAVETSEFKEVSHNKSEEKPRAECSSKEETTLETSTSEQTSANISNIQILSGSEDSFAQTPSSEKFTSFAMTENCGFGRRRKVRRIIRTTPNSASSNPIKPTLESEANSSLDVLAPPAKRVCSGSELSFSKLSSSVDKSPKSMELDSRTSGYTRKESVCEAVGQGVGINSGKSDSIESKVPHNESDNMLPEEGEITYEVHRERPTAAAESDYRKEDEHSCSTVYESCEVDLKVSSTDEQSIISENLSSHSQSDCSSLPPMRGATVEFKSRTTTYMEEYSLSSIEFDNNRISGPSESTPRSDRVQCLRDASPNEDRGRRPRSWERERNQIESPILKRDDGRRMRQSLRESYRDRDRRDTYYDRDQRSSRVSSSGGGGDRNRRMERDPRVDRNYRSRPHGSDSGRYRDDDGRRDSGSYRRTRSRERRNNDSFHRSSSRNRDCERGGGYPSRDRGRREVEDQERMGSRSSGRVDIHSRTDRSPKPTSLHSNDNLRSDCIPPTEWD